MLYNKMVLPVPTNRDSLTIYQYVDLTNRYFVLSENYFTTDGNAIFRYENQDFYNITEAIREHCFIIYRDFYNNFEHETDYTKPVSVSIRDTFAYYSPLTVNEINTIYNSCSRLYNLAFNFKIDVLERKNRNSNTYDSSKIEAYILKSDATDFSSGASDGGATPGSQANQLINGYKQIIFMTDALIYDLWSCMKTNINNMPSKNGTTYSLSSLANNLTSIITASNMIQVGGTPADPTFYNFGFNNDDNDKNIFKKNDYTKYKKYVSFALYTLSTLRNHPRFIVSNHRDTYLPLATPPNHSISETLDFGVSALMASLSALETTYDTRYSEGNYNAMKTNRDYINSNFKELYQYAGTAVHNSKTQYTATMVAGTVWSVLAVGLIYYTYTLE